MRLARLRKERGFTQLSFALEVGISQRMIAYYEKHAKRPPLEKLETMAKILKVSINEILGTTPPVKLRGNTQEAYLQRKLLKVTQFSKADQKVVVGMIDALASKPNKGN